jgi:hypothetical protein
MKSRDEKFFEAMAKFRDSLNLPGAFFTMWILKANDVIDVRWSVVFAPVWGWCAFLLVVTAIYYLVRHP